MSSSNSSGLPSPSMEYGLVAASFNSAMFNVLLFGMYSIIYACTVYIYLRRKGVSKANVSILAAITAMFLVNIMLVAVNWFITQQAFMKSIGLPIDGTFVTIYRELAISWAVLVADCGSLVLTTLADALLTWRCYHVWGQSIRAIALPVTFILAEVALNLALIIIACINHLFPSPPVAALLNHLLAAAIFMSVGSTVLTSTMIAYRIYCVSRETKGDSQRRTFVAILDSIVQSAAVYTIVSIFYAIQGVIPTSLSTEATITDLQEFTTQLFLVTAGAAPTIMVARVALATRSPEGSGRGQTITNLEFHEEASSEMSPNISGTAYEEKMV